jgi:hypothetical protein
MDSVVEEGMDSAMEEKSGVESVITTGYKMIDRLKSTIKTASTVNLDLDAPQETDAVMIEMKKAFDHMILNISRVTLETVMWADFKEKLQQVAVDEMHKAKSEQEQELLQAKHNKWQERLATLKRDSGFQVAHPDKVMAYPVELAQAWIAQPMQLTVPAEQLQAAREFALSVFSAALRCMKGSELEEMLRERLLAQATNAVWFAVVWDYIRAYEMSNHDEHCPLPQDLLQKDAKEVYRITIKYGLEHDFDYLVKFQTLLKRGDYYPFPEKDLKSLADDTQSALGFAPQSKDASDQEAKKRRHKEEHQKYEEMSKQQREMSEQIKSLRCKQHRKVQETLDNIEKEWDQKIRDDHESCETQIKKECEPAPGLPQGKEKALLEAHQERSWQMRGQMLAQQLKVVEDAAAERVAELMEEE